MCFYLHLFDVSQSKYKSKYLRASYRELKCEKEEFLSDLFSDLLSQHPQGMGAAYDSLKEAMEKLLRRNAFSVVCLDTIFSSINSQHKTPSLNTGVLDISDGSDDEVVS